MIELFIDWEQRKLKAKVIYQSEGTNWFELQQLVRFYYYFFFKYLILLYLQDYRDW